MWRRNNGCSCFNWWENSSAQVFLVHIFEKCSTNTFICLQGDAVGLNFSRLLERRPQLSTTAITSQQQSRSSSGNDDPNTGEIQEVGNGTYPDVLLLGSGGTIHAHKLMLSMRSPVLRDLIK